MVSVEDDSQKKLDDFILDIYKELASNEQEKAAEYFFLYLH